jgi:hypothetical protein
LEAWKLGNKEIMDASERSERKEGYGINRVRMDDRTNVPMNETKKDGKREECVRR